MFGLGSASKVAFGFSEAVFPVLLATSAGTSLVEPRLLWSAAALGTSRRAALLRVVVPAALPAILTGARIGLVGAIVGVFLGEMIAGADGLGHMMAVAYRTLETPDMYVAILTVSICGYVLDRAFLAARGWLPAWSAEEAPTGEAGRDEAADRRLRRHLESPGSVSKGSSRRLTRDAPASSSPPHSKAAERRAQPMVVLAGPVNPAVRIVLRGRDPCSGTWDHGTRPRSGPWRRRRHVV